MRDREDGNMGQSQSEFGSQRVRSERRRQLVTGRGEGNTQKDRISQGQNMDRTLGPAGQESGAYSDRDQIVR